MVQDSCLRIDVRNEARSCKADDTRILVSWKTHFATQATHALCRHHGTFLFCRMSRGQRVRHCVSEQAACIACWRCPRRRRSARWWTIQAGNVSTGHVFSVPSVERSSTACPILLGSPTSGWQGAALRSRPWSSLRGKLELFPVLGIFSFHTFRRGLAVGNRHRKWPGSIESCLSSNILRTPLFGQKEWKQKAGHSEKSERCATICNGQHFRQRGHFVPPRTTSCCAKTRWNVYVDNSNGWKLLSCTPSTSIRFHRLRSPVIGNYAKWFWKRPQSQCPCVRTERSKLDWVLRRIYENCIMVTCHRTLRNSRNLPRGQGLLFSDQKSGSGPTSWSGFFFRERNNLLWIEAPLCVWWVRWTSRLKSKRPSRFQRKDTTAFTANGTTRTTAQATVYVKDVHMFVTVQLLKDSAAVLDLGNSAKNMGNLLNGEKANHNSASGGRVRRTTSSDRLRDVPDRLEEFSGGSADRDSWLCGARECSMISTIVKPLSAQVFCVANQLACVSGLLPQQGVSKVLSIYSLMDTRADGFSWWGLIFRPSQSWWSHQEVRWGGRTSASDQRTFSSEGSLSVDAQRDGRVWLPRFRHSSDNWQGLSSADDVEFETARSIALSNECRVSRGRGQELCKGLFGQLRHQKGGRDRTRHLAMSSCPSRTTNGLMTSWTRANNSLRSLMSPMELQSAKTIWNIWQNRTAQLLRICNRTSKHNHATTTHPHTRAASGYSIQIWNKVITSPMCCSFCPFFTIHRYIYLSLSFSISSQISTCVYFWPSLPFASCCFIFIRPQSFHFPISFLTPKSVSVSVHVRDLRPCPCSTLILFLQFMSEPRKLDESLCCGCFQTHAKAYRVPWGNRTQTIESATHQCQETWPYTGELHCYCDAAIFCGTL